MINAYRVRGGAAAARVRIAVMEWRNVTRADWIVIGIALLLAVDLLFLPWVDFSIGQYATLTPATGNPTPYLGVLALVASIAFIIDLVLERATDLPLPAVGGSTARTRRLLAVAAAAAIALKLVASLNHLHDLGLGCWLALIGGGLLFLLAERPEPAATPSRT